MHSKGNVYIVQGPEVFELARPVFTIPSGTIDADGLFHPLRQSIEPD